MNCSQLCALYESRYQAAGSPWPFCTMDCSVAARLDPARHVPDTHRKRDAWHLPFTPASLIKYQVITSRPPLFEQPDSQTTSAGIAEMMNEFQPRIGDWYQNITGDNFEIVALDEDETTMEIQYYDGAIEEIDFDTWNEMEIVPIEPPEDWSGSLDIEREDYGVDLELTSPNDHINPIDELE
jgi:hypothetical protein